MQFNIIFKTIFEYIHKKFRFVHTCTNTFCKYRKKLRASPRVHLVLKCDSIFLNFASTIMEIEISPVDVIEEDTDTRHKADVQARQTRPNSGGVAEGHPRFDKGGGSNNFLLFTH